MASEAYNLDMTKRTSLNLDMSLVKQAREVLGTNGTTETVHKALAEVVRQEKLRQLAAWEFSMSNEEIEASEAGELDETFPDLR
ncbi:MAG TPA: type II toxin-antitoxin system VapB family antitoxin [Gaiellaceae bacterium]|nr:type II toxin-antitoxin system VapB family antitoxin [Gaiellaceae bacterium]